MSANSAAARYDRALLYGHTGRLPPDCPRPQPTVAWPPENVALLEQYREWLSSGGTSPFVVKQLYIPMAGHALGLNLKPHPQLDLDADLERALDYVKAKQLSAEWTDMCRCALDKFRRFLRQQRGYPDVVIKPPKYVHYCAGLPDWLVEQLEHYQHLMQRHWRPARLNQQIISFWNTHTHLWRWLCERHPIAAPADVKRQHLLDYVDHCLTAGYAVSTINNRLRCFHGLLLFLQEQDYSIPQALLRIPSLKQPDRLPRFLTDEQVAKLRDDFERRVAEARYSVQKRDALLDRAAFYLLWQSGLRLGEAEELRLEDLDTSASLSAGLPARKLMVRQGKGRKDRAVYLADAAARALQDYLAVRGMGPTDHVFLYRNGPVHKDLLRSRLRAAGERVGVEVSPHRLRHTCATQLLNAGCRVTSIQSLLGHRRLNSTLVYARVHDHTVANDYYAAMSRIEKSLALADETENAAADADRARLLQLAERLAEPQLGDDARLDLVAQLRRALDPAAQV